MSRGVFVTFEGCEGCGKSTHINLLKDYLEGKGLPFKVLREPGGTVLGEEIRHLLKSPKYSPCAEAELLLMNASRAQLVRETIIPALSSGEMVICDRFYDSTLAYQGYGRGLEINMVNQVIRAATSISPDVTFFIDLSPEQGMANIKYKNNQGDRFDDETLAFHNRVYAGYKRIIEDDKRFRVIPYIPDGVTHMQGQIRFELSMFL